MRQVIARERAIADAAGTAAPGVRLSRYVGPGAAFWLNLQRPVRLGDGGEAAGGEDQGGGRSGWGAWVGLRVPHIGHISRCSCIRVLLQPVTYERIQRRCR